MAGPVKKFITSIKMIIMHMSLLKLMILVIILIGFFIGVAITVTTQPGFCNSCHIMNDYYASWEESSHNEVSCLSCHLEPGFTSYMKGKINGLAQAVDCMVGRISTKPSAHVSDESCLRSACHNTEELAGRQINFNGIKFTHDKHIDKVVDGVDINCGTCHSHFEGEEHFSVNSKTCFACHFLKSENTPEKLTKTKCLSCHDVPDKVIERGFVKINHLEFVSYDASCEDSCHKGQVEMHSNVSDTMCLNCHSFGMKDLEEELSSKELHELHTHGEKVECFACHGETYHGPTATDSVASMASCKNCHSDTHSVQQSIFGAEHHPTTAEDNKILSPMFLTHVECSDCHTQRERTSSAVIDSFGTVAKASAVSCDKCHEEGTGERYIPFWQSRKVTFTLKTDPFKM